MTPLHASAATEALAPIRRDVIFEGVCARGEVPSIREPDFTAEVFFGDVVELRLAGSAEVGVSQTLEHMLCSLHDELVVMGVRGVVVKMYDLEFMCAGTLNAFAVWLWKVIEMAPELRYQVRFLSNPDFLWQRRTLQSLSSFAVDLVRIE